MTRIKFILLHCFIIGIVGIGIAQEDKIYYDLKEAQENPIAVYGLHIAVDRLEEAECLFMDSLNGFPNLVELIITNYSYYRSSDQHHGFPLFVLKLPKLKKLRFEDYDLKRIPKAIKGLVELEQLELVNTRLEHFPESITALKKLKILKIKKNYFNELPRSISKLKKLKTLVVNAKLVALPSSCSKLTHLEYLDLSSNSFDTLPLAIHQLKQLKTLKLNYCKIRTISSGFGDFSKLTTLELKGNELKELPEFFSKMIVLERLNLRRNALEVFPDVITHLSTLIELDISRNQLKFFPETFDNLKALIQLNLSYNGLQEFPTEILELKKLTHLELLKNNLKKLPERIQELKEIQQINLCLNDLEALPKSIGELSKLEVLDCSFCYLKEIPKSILKLTRLKELNLKYNELERTPSFLINSKQKLKLYLVGNEYLTDRKEKKARIDSSVKQFIDQRDNKLYETVQINNQIWMAEDLKFKTTRSIADTITLNSIVRKYLFEEVRNVCPQGWHNATTEDWRTLFKEVETEFPVDPQGYYNSRMKEERVVVVDNREDPLIMFDPSYRDKSYRVTTYLVKENGMSRKDRNFYNLNIDVRGLGRFSRSRIIRSYYGTGKDKKHRLYGFMNFSRFVKEKVISKEKIAKKYYPVRCVKDK